jgi:hypothetical protein
VKRLTLAGVCAVLAAAIWVRAFEPPFEAGYPYNFYYGSLHSHTTYSDGGHPNNSSCASSTSHLSTDATPSDAYAIARNAGLDFFAVSDHNHQFNDACPGCSAAQIVQRYHDGLATAASATVGGTFVAMYGMEWGYISNPDAGFPNEGHVGVMESPKLFGWEPSSCTVGSSCYYDLYTSPNAGDYLTMYQTALNNPSAWGAFGHFEHPSDGTKSAAGQGVDFNSFAFNSAADDFIHTIAVISGPATDFSTLGTDTGARYAGDPMNGSQYSVYTSTDMYNRALSAGFHVAPVADFDTHCSTYGLATRDRTVVLSSTLTKASILDAIHNRRVFATSSKRGQLIYTMAANGTTYHMGAGSIRTQGPVSTSGSITLHAAGFDPNGATVTSIKIKEPVPGATNGAATVVASTTTTPFDFTFTPASGNHIYYAYVTLSTGDEMWSAPIWINHAAAPDTTPPTTSITSPADGATVSGTTTVAAAASDNVGVTKVEFYLDNVLQTTDTASPYQWSWNTTGTASGAHSLTTKAYDAAGNVGTSAAVNVTVSNVADTTPPSAPSNLTAVSTLRRRATLTWSASTDNVAVAGYTVWRSTALAGPYAQVVTVNALTYTNSGLTSGTTYYFYVTASDAAGNVSPASNTASVKVR